MGLHLAAASFDALENLRERELESVFARREARGEDRLIDHPASDRQSWIGFGAQPAGASEAKDVIAFIRLALPRNLLNVTHRHVRTIRGQTGSRRSEGSRQ
jgi:hypothetical protein